MSSSASLPLRLAIGGDHAGFPLKHELVGWLGGQVTELIDCGATDATSSDYPDFALAVGKAVLEGRADRGILVCGSGVGVSVAANKIPGIRASLCHDTYSARQGVEHDDMNVLCIGARVIGPELAMEVIRAFLAARYEPQPRHARRVEKILQIERDALAGKFG
ncbi:ribose 5-phosphate isomerase B [Candidatus Laterigemmans baculatus]|uniref:ribose 5-phosphate isomerase B n=1 Tax=Candidatus Laterigemmans baculatus TaxID=2770505 RepID=UPI0013DA7EC3|nr:ribose 5-phosphate isomerase B [Candidatus Laterigemmans baculatus]